MNNKDDPRQLIWGQPYIDARRLVSAIEEDLRKTSEPDFRTRLLVRDAAKAVRSFWSSKKFTFLLSKSPAAPRIRAILDEYLGKTGFPNIRKRLVPGSEQDQINKIFALLGKGIDVRVEINVAGSIPTLLGGLTARPTADIFLVDEVPAAIRNQRVHLQRIKHEYGLALGHIRSRYLPLRWQNRRHFLDDFGGLRVYLVDAYDIFISKLSSKLQKHKDDVRVLAMKLDKNIAKKRLFDYGQGFLSDPRIRKAILENWQFLLHELLVLEEPAKPIERPKRGRKASSTEKTKPRRRKPK
ncbi:MAG: DUF6036 family nucleotidyltransferase [Gemmataceae bacterium]